MFRRDGVEIILSAYESYTYIPGSWFPTMWCKYIDSITKIFKFQRSRAKKERIFILSGNYSANHEKMKLKRESVNGERGLWSIPHFILRLLRYIASDPVIKALNFYPVPWFLLLAIARYLKNDGDQCWVHIHTHTHTWRCFK